MSDRWWLYWQRY